MNQFFSEKKLPTIKVPDLANYPRNFSFESGTDKHLDKEASRAIRRPFLQNMFTLGFTSSIPMSEILNKRNKKVNMFHYFFLMIFSDSLDF